MCQALICKIMQISTFIDDKINYENHSLHVFGGVFCTQVRRIILFLGGRMPKKEHLAKSWGMWIREHPQTPSLLQKIMDTAMNDGDENQWTAIKMMVDRIAPHLKAVEMEVQGELSQGVIVLPEKKIRPKQSRGEVDQVAEEVIQSSLSAGAEA